MGNILKITNLQKSFGKKTVLKNVNLTMEEGHVIGIVGASESGKSTLLRTMMGMASVDEGRIEMFGNQINRNNQPKVQNVGALIQAPSFYQLFTGLEHLKLYDNSPDADQQIAFVSDYFKMNDYLSQPVSSYSLAMKQKLGLALAMVNHPQMLILDEPFVHLNMADQKRVTESIEKAKQAGQTVVITAENLTEITNLVDDVVVLDQGTVVTAGSLADLLDKSAQVYYLRTDADQTAQKLLKARGYLATKDDPIELTVSGSDSLNPLFQLLIDSQIQIESITCQHFVIGNCQF